jgi:hypothetical protein
LVNSYVTLTVRLPAGKARVSPSWSVFGAVSGAPPSQTGVGDEESHSPAWVTVTAGMLLKTTSAELDVDPLDVAPKLTGWREYPPPLTSFAPVSPGSAVCRLTFIGPTRAGGVVPFAT